MQWNACAFYVFKKYHQIDAEFWELFDQLSLETVINDTSNLTLKLLHPYEVETDLLIVEWRQKTTNKSITEVIETSDAAAKKVNQSEEEPEIVTDEDENRKITASEALKKLDEVKNFIEVNGRDHLSMIFNELIGNVKQMKLKIKNMLELSLDLKIPFTGMV